MLDKNKVLKMLLTLTGIVLLAGGFSCFVRRNSHTLGDYARENPELAYSKAAEGETGDTALPDSQRIPEDTDASAADSERERDTTENLQIEGNLPSEQARPIGVTLNTDSQTAQRITYKEAFYYEPLSDNLRRYITGVSFPERDSTADGASDNTELKISYEELCYLHLLHYDFDGNLAEGELICNKAIAQDLVEIFYQLYYNEYRIEKIRLIDEYDGDDTASMEDNNTSCFNYRVVEGSTSLSKHALGLAIDINPLYNPYVTYEKDGTEKISPTGAEEYADRSKSFPYKIDEKDLCYRLFTERGFIWGGNWNSVKDYQHFQKTFSR